MDENNEYYQRDHLFSTYAKFSEKLLFLTQSYMFVSGGNKWSFFGRFCVHTNWMIPNEFYNNAKHFKVLELQYGKL